LRPDAVELVSCHAAPAKKMGCAWATALITLCIGGGRGIATIIERVRSP
jgi:hypothetical protein